MELKLRSKVAVLFKRRFNTVFGIAAVASQGVAGILVIWLLKNEVGLEYVGFWAVMTGILSVLSVSEFGLGQALVHMTQVAKVSNEKDSATFKDYYHTTLIALFLFYSVALILLYKLLFSAMVQVSGENYTHLVTSILPVVCVSVIFGMLARVTFSGLNGLGYFWVSQLVILSANVVYLVASYFTINSFGVVGLAYSHLSMTFMMLALGHFSIVCLEIRQGKPLIRFAVYRFSYSCLKRMLPLGFSIQATSLLHFLLEPIVKTTIATTGGLEVVGVYEMVSRILQGLRELAVRPLGFLSGRFAKIFQTEKELLIPELRRYHSVSLVLGSIYFGIVLQFVHFLEDFWVQSGDKYSFLVFVLLGFSLSVNIVYKIPVYFYAIGVGENRVNLVSMFITAGVSCVGYMAALIFSMHELVIIFYGAGLAVGALYSYWKVVLTQLEDNDVVFLRKDVIASMLFVTMSSFIAWFDSQTMVNHDLIVRFLILGLFCAIALALCLGVYFSKNKNNV